MGAASILSLEDQNISETERKKIRERQWLKYSYVIGRIVQKSIWKFEGTWDPSLINRFQDEFPEIDLDAKRVYVFINKLKKEISQKVEVIILQCSKAQNYTQTIGADYSDFDLKQAYRLTMKLIIEPLIREVYFSDYELKTEEDEIL